LAQRQELRHDAVQGQAPRFGASDGRHGRFDLDDVASDDVRTGLVMANWDRLMGAMKSNMHQKNRIAALKMRCDESTKRVQQLEADLHGLQTFNLVVVQKVQNKK
tara:strand:- start:16 stop:330 length:315 start_codon:yes stop_codon:yes gene_type:complete